MGGMVMTMERSRMTSGVAHDICLRRTESAKDERA
jgi:hypothetical protein